MTQKTKRPAVQGPGAIRKNQNHQQYTPAERILSLLAGVKSTGPDRWIARCPAHADRHPSLSVRETGGGTLLVKCWTGCGAADIVAALGLELRDLFPVSRADHRPLRPGERWSPGDVLRCLAREAWVVLIAARDMLHGQALPKADVERLATAAQRFQVALEELGHGR